MDQNESCTDFGSEPSTTVFESASVFPPIPIFDDGRARLGKQISRSLPEIVADDGQVRLGGQAPMFLPDTIADAGLVRLGGQSPTF